MTDSTHAPVPMDGTLFGPEQPCFGCGPAHPIGFHLKFQVHEDSVVCRFVPAAVYQGPPGVMHGGLVMTLADEVAAWAVIALLGKFGFTGKFDARFLKAVRIGVELEARSTIVKDAGRLADVEVTIRQQGELMFSANVRFVVLDQHGAERLLQAPLPEAWKRFCR